MVFKNRKIYKLKFFALEKWNQLNANISLQSVLLSFGSSDADADIEIKKLCKKLIGFVHCYFTDTIWAL